MEKVLQDRTSIVIAHRLSTVRNANMIVALQDGRIVEKGTHAELLTHDGLYKKLYDMQFKDEPDEEEEEAEAPLEEATMPPRPEMRERMAGASGGGGRGSSGSQGGRPAGKDSDDNSRV
jgi:ATP-binding cassette subfamily B multidrug efflux pump